MTFAKKARQAAITITTLATIEIIIGIICYKLHVLGWYLALIALCFIIEILTFIIMDRRESRKNR